MGPQNRRMESTNNLSTQGRLYGLLRRSDVLAVVVDLSQDSINQVRDSFRALEDWSFVLLGSVDNEEDHDSEFEKPIIVVGNKADLQGSLDTFQALESEFGDYYPVVLVSAEEKVGFDELGEAIFRALDIIHVYTNSPQEKKMTFSVEPHSFFLKAPRLPMTPTTFTKI